MAEYKTLKYCYVGKYALYNSIGVLFDKFYYNTVDKIRSDSG